MNNKNNKDNTDENNKGDNETSTAVNIKATDAITKLGELISSLITFAKPKNNLHNSVKEQLRIISVTYNRALDELGIERMEPPKETQQMSPKSPKSNARSKKRSRDSSEESPKNKPKKTRKRSSNTEEKTDAISPIQEVNNIATSSDWSMVRRKKRKRQNTNRPSAMIISANGETTYAEILRKMKADPELQNFGKSVRRIRRTQKGALLLEINSSDKDETKVFNELVGKTLGESAKIQTKISETLIECKDLDEITTQEDICAALKDQLEAPDLEESIVKNIRKAYGGTQTAKISLPDALAQKALKLGKLKIGWSICRVREPIVLQRCFRCLEYGHISSSCNSSVDRSKLCRKCGEANHIAKDCTSEPRCMFCVANKDPEIGHIAGSSKCPVFRKALSSSTR